MKKYMTLALLLINLLLNAEVRYVSKTGSSTAPYTTWKTACDSLQKCFDYCNNGDTVYVDRGIYRETILLDNRVLTIIGVDTDECIIDGTGLIGKVYANVLLLQKNGSINFKNILFKRKRTGNEFSSYDYYNMRGHLNFNNCIFDTSKNALIGDGNTDIQNCIFRCVNNGIQIGFEYHIKINNSLMNIFFWDTGASCITNSVYNGSFEITNNIFYTSPNNILFITGIDILTGHGLEIQNNLFYGFSGGIEGYTDMNNPDTINIINNTLICGSIKGDGIISGNLQGPVVVKNNIFSGFKTGIGLLEFRIDADYNLFHNVTRVTNMLPIGEHNIVADPMFNKDTTFSFDAIDNFRLQKFSPAIDTGDPSILDVDGSRSDIGMFGGPNGISYEYMDLAPKVVKKLKAVYESDTNRVKLTWEPNTEADLKQYYVYKDINPSFTLDSTKRIAILSDTLFYDKLEKGTQKVYYKVTATDMAGNQSYPSAEVNVTITDINEVTITENYEYALYQNYPNPFNPTTTISYSLKDESEVRIKIYAITGELIKTIIEGNKSKGYNETQIDLSNMASGIYLYRLEVTGKGKIPIFNDLKKMVLVK
jgi:hypothetical protein